MRPTDSLSTWIARTAVAALIAIGALIGVGAGEADAAVFCVDTPTCPLGTQKATIDQALGDAEVNGQTDTVKIGAMATPYTDGNGFSYVSNETVHINGAGVGETVLAATSFSNTLTVLSPSSTVEHMTLTVPNLSNGAGLRWNGTASNVEMVQAPNPVGSVLGAIPEGAAVLEDSSVEVETGYALSGQQLTNLTVRDSSFESGMSGMSFSGSSPSVNLSRVAIKAPRGAMSFGGNTNATIENVLVRMLTGGSPGDSAVQVSNGADVVLSHATVVGPGTKAGLTVGASSTGANLTVKSSVIRGFEKDLYRLGSGFAANLGISYSSYDGSKVSSSGDGALIQGAGNLTNADPLFKTPLLEDYRLKATSPLVDAGDPSSASAEDLRGEQRKIDGDGDGGSQVDIGAYEYQHRAPTAVLDGPGTADAGVAVSFASSGSSDPDDEGLIRSWDLGDGTGAQGASPSHTYSTGGTFTVTLTVTDPAGLTGTATKQIVVSAPPAGGGQPGDPGQGGAGEPGDTPQGDEDPATATLSDLRVQPKRVRIGSAAPRLLDAAKGSRIDFALTAAAGVKLRFERKLDGGYVPARGTISVDARAGENSVRFQGRTSKRRALRPGSYKVIATAGDAPTDSARFKVVG